MTLYQKVKKALPAAAPVTYPRLADQLCADEDAVHRALIDLLKRGKAQRVDTRANPKAELWAPRS